jgi:two-component system, NtrC family, response regulator AtoC
VRVWALAKGHKGKTCQMLGISRPTLERKLKKYRIAGGVD